MFPQWIRHSNMIYVFCIGNKNLEGRTSHIDGICDRMEVLEIPLREKKNDWYWVLETRARRLSSIFMFRLIWNYPRSICVQLCNYICRIHYNSTTIKTPLWDCTLADEETWWNTLMAIPTWNSTEKPWKQIRVEETRERNRLNKGVIECGQQQHICGNSYTLCRPEVRTSILAVHHK